MRVTDTYSLLEPALVGDPRAKEALFEALRARLVLWCASRMSPALRARVEPEDLAQEALLVITRDLGDYAGKDRGTFYAWVFRIAENRIRDAAGHFGAAKRQAEPIRRRPPTTPGAAASRNESVQRLVHAIEALREDHRRVVQLRRLEEREFGEIAAELGRTENAERILYCRALKELRERLEPGV